MRYCFKTVYFSHNAFLTNISFISMTVDTNMDAYIKKKEVKIRIQEKLSTSASNFRSFGRNL